MANGARRGSAHRPRVGVVKFASCDGCQLTILDLEDQLLAITEKFDIVEFAEATSNRSQGPFDVLLVEGSISTPEQAREIVQLRREATTLVAIGACATSGGIQALRNLADHDAFRDAVYPQPQFISSLLVSTHAPAQSVRPVPQPLALHVPAEQASPAAHATPQPPQFAGSLVVSTHAPAHSVSPAPHTHALSEQI